jgi:hypothetical protein
LTKRKQYSSNPGSRVMLWSAIARMHAARAASWATR